MLTSDQAYITYTSTIVFTLVSSFAAPVSGLVMLMDTFNSVTTNVVNGTFVDNVVVFSLPDYSVFSVGVHNISATYLGDANCNSASSNYITVVVTKCKQVL